ncbi:von Willebrand factor D and EGF domain-containing protein-like [Hydractinia symbiolongicarpus]|uniref:von Willebrand factor D and EGF domain-containing protein-like n=1 Tax=Hydractinia symbiolongicarpus TaxID=13093 RepID=UPI00254FC346|nr:von Willebrand factor D and EGF domain-containing protein-like [Hydractinia symbiolongicarpus]
MENADKLLVSHNQSSLDKSSLPFLLLLYIFKSYYLYKLLQARYPKLKRDPVLSVDVNNETKRIRFKCEFDPQETGANIYHIVAWYQGLPEERIQQTNRFVDVGKTEAYLENNNTYGINGGKPLFCLGHKISCKVRSYYSDAPEIKSSARKSNEFYAGFEINPKKLELREGKDRKHIIVTTTIPVVCEGHCAVRLEYGQNSTDLSSSNCELNFTNGVAGRSKNITVFAKTDWHNGGNKYIHLRFNVAEHANPVDWNCYKSISNVVVKVKDEPSGICQTSGEPHVNTFDGMGYHYNYVGDLVLTNSTARLFQVHVRTHYCNATYPCNCAVAAREGDDVVVIDLCRPPYTVGVKFLSTVQPRLTTVERSNDGKNT